MTFFLSTASGRVEEEGITPPIYSISPASISGRVTDATRRAVVERLTAGPAAVSELARPFRMALPSFLQHLKVLEDCGLVLSRKQGRVRTCRIAPRTLKAAQGWLDKQRALWERRLDQLDQFLKESDHEY